MDVWGGYFASGSRFVFRLHEFHLHEFHLHDFYLHEAYNN